MPVGKPKTRASKSQLIVRHGAKRNELNIDKDTWYIVGEVAKGRTYQSIADELNAKNKDYSLSGESVRLDVERALVEWKRENMENIDAYIAKELLRIEDIETKILNDYENSKRLKPHDYAALMKRGMEIEEIDEMFETRPIAGDPHFLQVLLNLQMQRMKLLGIDKGNDISNNTIINYDFRGINIDDLTKIADTLQDNQFRKEVDEQ